MKYFCENAPQYHVAWWIHLFVICLIALYLLVVEKIPVFSGIRQPLPRNIGLRGKGLAISIAAAIIFPLIVLYTGAFGLWGFFGEEEFSLFALGNANRAFVVTIGMSLLGLIMIFVYGMTEGKRQKAGLRDYGLTSEGKKGLDFILIWKSLALSVIVAAIGWAYLGLQEKILGTEFFAWFFGVRSLPMNKARYYIPYIIVWMLCFIVTSIGVNVERRLPSTGSEKKDTIIAVVFNAFCICFTLTVMVIIQNTIQVNSPIGVRALANFGVDITRIWGMPTGMALAGAGHTILYRKTGSIWPGVFLMGIICALCCVLYGQVTY